MSDVRGPGHSNEGVSQSGTMAPPCGSYTVTTDGKTVVIGDECMCGCDAYYERCSRWSYEGPTADHPCC